MTNSRLYMLVVAPAFPYPIVDGHTLRNYNLLRNLSDRITFDLLTLGESTGFLHDRRLIGQLGEQCHRVHLVDRASLRSLELSFFQRVKNVFSPHPFSCGEGVSDELMKALETCIISKRYDLLYCCGVSMGAYAQPFVGKIPLVVDAVDSFSLLQSSFLSNAMGVKRRVKGTIDLIWGKRYERRHLGRIADLIFVSPIDRDSAMRNCPYSDTWVVPNGVDTDYFKSEAMSERVSTQLLFTGVMDYPPNHDAMMYFMEQILPRIRQEIPETSLVIAGRNPLPVLQSCAQQCGRVQITGFVEDMRPYFETSAVYIAPLRSGAGMKNKVLEAWAMGIPVVATSVSCNGIAVDPGKNILMADSPEDFSKQVIQLLRNPGLRSLLANGGRQTAEMRYSWKEQSIHLEEILHRARLREKPAA